MITPLERARELNDNLDELYLEWTRLPPDDNGCHPLPSKEMIWTVVNELRRIVSCLVDELESIESDDGEYSFDLDESN